MPISIPGWLFFFAAFIVCMAFDMKKLIANPLVGATRIETLVVIGFVFLLVGQGCKAYGWTLAATITLGFAMAIVPLGLLLRLLLAIGSRRLR
ncbi:MAG TPA: hypothetical protein VEA36_02375 [Candidatus Paceibacterota bacterium]|nr:hypothetical protein [Candidatus Paceibacterota bacterium]